MDIKGIGASPKMDAKPRAMTGEENAARVSVPTDKVEIGSSKSGFKNRIAQFAKKSASKTNLGAEGIGAGISGMIYGLIGAAIGGIAGGAAGAAVGASFFGPVGATISSIGGGIIGAGAGLAIGAKIGWEKVW